MCDVINRSAALAMVAMASASAGALTVPFTETFAANNSSWTNSANGPAAYLATGGPDGSGYASAPFNFASTNAGSTPAILRCQNTTGASGGNFFGDWITGGVTTLSFDIRHDASVALQVFARWTSATAPAFPGIIALGSTVQPNTWTTVTLDVTSGGTYVPEPGAVYANIFSNVARVQYGALPGALAGQAVTVNFDIDNVRIVPTPGAAAIGLVGLVGLRRRR